MAAIIGIDFSFKLLESIYPIPDARADLMEHLLTLRKLGIINFAESTKPRESRFLEQIHGKIGYSFKDLVYKEVAYNLMLFAQKRQLHEHIAKWYENFLSTLSRYKQKYHNQDITLFANAMLTYCSKLFAILIQHWEGAGNKEKARHYARRAIIVARWATLRKVLVSQRIPSFLLVHRFSLTQS